jgi:hypothetical protein
MISRLNEEYARLTKAVVPSVVSIDTAGGDIVGLHLPKYTVSLEDKTPYSLMRKLNGFSSPTIIRGLALAANAELLDSPSMESNDPIDLEVNDAGLARFKKLLSSLVSELEYIDDPERVKPQKKKMKQNDWYATQLFREGATAPQSGFQDRARLGNMLTEWSQKGKIDFVTNFKFIRKETHEFFDFCNSLTPAAPP